MIFSSFRSLYLSHHPERPVAVHSCARLFESISHPSTVGPGAVKRRFLLVSRYSALVQPIKRLLRKLRQRLRHAATATLHIPPLRAASQQRSALFTSSSTAVNSTLSHIHLPCLPLPCPTRQPLLCFAANENECLCRPWCGPAALSCAPDARLPNNTPDTRHMDACGAGSVLHCRMCCALSSRPLPSRLPPKRRNRARL